MLIEIVIFFLGLSIVFYVLFGGADFGAGVLEILSGKGDRETIAHAIGPVWEANHVWLVLVVVILFMAFPKVYAAMSVHLHIPLLLMLVGIVLRGTAFTYMHYDAIKDETNDIYNAVFKISSVFTPLFLGVIAGAATLGKINPEPEHFVEGFITPWLNLFSFSVGLFTVTLFTFLAAIYLIGETSQEKQRSAFTKTARNLNIAAVFIGILVFASAHFEGLTLLSMFLDSWFAILMAALATLLLPAIWWSLQHYKVILSRIFAAGQVVAILLAWFWVQYPSIINRTDGFEDLTFYNTAAPDATLTQLVWALVIGSCIILPCLFYLMRVFKGGQFTQSKTNQ
ncbi:cytochrome d ubiquinol oxidase subunit II [Gracilimonas mengyeensis]|uniref:Cytochrome bd-I ubiquinol oxidase subunit 2 apoprotein n=1 Tax=Gracilimonas mengyeensis TaxID=1302730 RepID=A0A521CMB9_9BACT|nr:cytochrome d ubiquinol oxidase subunit II [Gracilimonas mengyeensis]SMO60582.1 cytochrome bd-I ubiquinol oxidase subunit 2 apoprotein [Gracilimonas mengyeensis]